MNRGDGYNFDNIGGIVIDSAVSSDNLGHGVLVNTVPNGVVDGDTRLDNSVVIAHSALATNETLNATAVYGIVTPRSEWFSVFNTEFVNYDIGYQAAIKTCAYCDVHYTLTDSGARTVSFKGITYCNVPKYINYTWPYRAILHDLDGSLTLQGPNSWATPDWRHNRQPGCSQSAPHNGLVCDSTVQVRRVAFYNYAPSIFDNTDLRIL